MSNFLSGALGAISPYLGVAQAGAGLFGLMGASAAERRAQEMRQRILADISRNNDQAYNDLAQRNQQGLYSATGQAGDALSQLGRRLGSAAAEGGVYDSSAVAGALTQAQQNANAALTNMATQNNYNQRSLLNQNQQQNAGLQLGAANSDLGYAQNQYAGSANGLASFLGSLTQQNLSQNSVPNSREVGVAMNGNQNATLPNIWQGTVFDPQGQVLLDPANTTARSNIGGAMSAMGGALTGFRMKPGWNGTATGWSQ